MVKKLCIIGPAWPLRGSLAAFDEKLARLFSADGIDTSIYTFSLQYPSLLFPGTSQYSNEPAPADIQIDACINSINPFNWLRIGRKIQKEKPDLIIVRFWIPFMAPCLGIIVRIAKLNKHTKVISIVDNMIPHEKRMGDALLTRFFVGAVDGFLTMSEKVKTDLGMFTTKPNILSPHPIFDHFGTAITKESAREMLAIEKKDKIILFFGFIRKYKGLDLLIKSMANEAIQKEGIHLMIVGEFYESKLPYLALIESLHLQDRIHLYDQYVPDAAVKNYVCAADFVIQPYKNATQSGVTPLAYHFLRPMLVTNVGGLADTVPNGKVGLVVEPNSDAIAEGILSLYKMGPDFFQPYLIEEKKKYSWEQMKISFLTLYNQL